MSEDLLRLGKLVREARTAAGLSAREVADAAGFSASYLRAIERGSNPKTQSPSTPSLEVLLGIAGALGMDAAELLPLAGYDPTLAGASPLRAGAAARGAADDLVRQVQEAVKRLSGRSRFMYDRTLERFEGFTAEFRAMAAGTLQCTSEEEPRLTRLAVDMCRSHLRAISYQDVVWWQSDAGDRYLEHHATLMDAGVDMTRIFLVEEAEAQKLRPTFERHVQLGIQTFVLSPRDVPDRYWRDVVIYDDVLVRTALTTDPSTERKMAEFSDDPGRVAQALEDFKRLHRIASDSFASVEQVLARLQQQSGVPT